MSVLDGLITTPIYECTLPSSGKPIKFRPFVVKEERALLMAQESENNKTMINTISTVVKNCIIGAAPELSTFDVEYLFVQLRMKSIDENSTLIFTCSNDQCKEKTAVNIPLKDVYVKKNDSISTTIKMDGNIAFVMRYPTIEEVTDEDDLVSSIAASIKAIYKGDQVIDVAGLTRQEVSDFIDNQLTRSQFAKLKEFYENIPETCLDLKWKCPKCGHDHEVELKGLNSFF